MEKKISKCLCIGCVTFVFWIISLIIGGIVDGRSELSEVIRQEISQTWGDDQKVTGPVLCVPVFRDSLQIPYTCMYVLPQRIDTDADVKSKILQRGIYDVPVFRTKVTVHGTFDLREMTMKGEVPDKKKHVRYGWNQAQVIFGIGDKRGIENRVDFQIGGKKICLNRRFTDYGNHKIKPLLSSSSDMICQTIDLEQLIGKEVDFSLESNLKGALELDVAPIGQDSRVTIHGECPDPSFVGIMLPSERNVTNEGFTAVWNMNSLNCNYAEQVFCSDGQVECFCTVGTKFLVVGGQYIMTDRALKYAFLVILLSLVAVFVGELSVKSEINTLNYLLIGAALTLFYLMLLSFGEWIGFSLAYLVSTILIIGMITMYLNAIVRRRKTALAVCLFLIMVYVFVYILLGMEDMALLVGTLGLFFVLGVAMFFSLRLKFPLNWEEKPDEVN